jgi:hypothetical protein
MAQEEIKGNILAKEGPVGALFSYSCGVRKGEKAWFDIKNCNLNTKG